jgi:rhodanese-related sulfurtransferase
VRTGGAQRAVRLRTVPRIRRVPGNRSVRGRVGTLALVVVLLAVGLLAVGCRSIQSDPRRPGLRVRPGVAFEMVADAPDMPILDLRRPDEFDGALGHLQRAHNLPLEELPHRLPEIRWLRERTFLIYCRGRTGPQDEEAGDAEVEDGAIEEGTAEEEATGEEAIGEEATEEQATGEEAAGDEEVDCGEQAIRFFLAQGFVDAVLLDGGIEAWLKDGFATVGRDAQGPQMGLSEDSGLRLPEDSKSIGDPRHLPKPP